MHSTTPSVSLLLTLLPLTYARTDLSGCTSTTAGASIIYFVPGTGELCDFLDCGGGRAPPKTTVPGCPQYAGTATYSPSFLPGFGAGAVESISTSVVAATSSPAITSAGSGGDVVTLTGTVSPSSTAVVSSSGSLSESLSSTGTGVAVSDSSTITLTSSTPSGNAASQTTSSGSSSSSGTGTGSGTSTGTAAGATNTNAGAVNAVNGVVGAVAAGIAFLL
ncbi:hypothetical protein DL98DRAFT_513210 [Cadophora sp. DSE1049]|nr:hypothetical protein DL98DRAFT_513210 [Cadophora sp. DSE1049]